MKKESNTESGLSAEKREFANWNEATFPPYTGVTKMTKKPKKQLGVSMESGEDDNKPPLYGINQDLGKGYRFTSSPKISYDDELPYDGPSGTASLGGQEKYEQEEKYDMVPEPLLPAQSDSPENNLQFHDLSSYDYIKAKNPRGRAPKLKPKEHIAVSKRSSPMFFEENEDSDLLRKSMKLGRLEEKTNISAIIVDKLNEQNVLQRIKCVGTPINGYAYDINSDCYMFSAVEYFQIGGIPLAYKVTVPNSGEWSSYIPLSLGVIESHLSPAQKKVLVTYREKYKDARYELHFIQSIG